MYLLWEQAVSQFYRNGKNSFCTNINRCVSLITDKEDQQVEMNGIFLSMLRVNNQIIRNGGKTKLKCIPRD